MRHSRARAFDSDLSYEQLLELFNRMGPWSWRDRDSAWYGNLATFRSDRLELALIESGANGVGGQVVAGGGRRYAASAVLDDDRPEADGKWQNVTSALDALLRAAGARNVCDTDVIDV